MEVLLKITGGKFIPEIQVPESITILEVKQQIEVLIKVEVDRQTLKFNNEELKNDKTIADYDIKSSADVALEVTPMPGDPRYDIVVKLSYQDGPVTVRQTSLVAEMRAKVARLWGIPLKNTTLKMGSIMIDDDEAPVSAYYLCPGCVIEAEIKAYR
ncbi:Ubiquitin domain-containing protein [Melia azedarach]|uniref:Ubiquitin domain-containing protein n=1 Tax=Melia azedarach TaxID=155640 RepID=A0ACC1X0W8_MELAZ|nr:Ubiquitin domain-containing protein [Melia azedarach]